MKAEKRDFMKLWSSLKTILLSTPSTENVFNQYRDRDDTVDLPDAAAIRTENLHQYMAEATEKASILVIGEAAGPWGCRFSGVPFTSEKQFLAPSFPIRGRRSSKNVPTCPIRMSPPFISRTSKIFWEVMQQHYGRFMVWNALPFHSHKPEDLFSVRNPTSRDVLQLGQFREAFHHIKEYLKPTLIIAVGKKAFNSLEEISETSLYVRHPSMGGKTKFTMCMQKIFKNQRVKC